MTSVGLSEAAVRRRGEALLWVALAAALAAAGAVLLWAADYAPLVPVALVGLAVAAFVLSHPRLNFVLWLGGIVMLLSFEEGIQAQEAAYGLYFYLFLGHWYGSRLLRRETILRGPEDVTVATLLGLGLTVGVALGLLFNAPFASLRGEAIAFTMLATYFPVKEFCRREEKGPLIVILLLGWIGCYLTVDNALVARQTFAEATQVWQIADVRTAGRELLLLYPALLYLALLTAQRGARRTLLVTAAFSILLAGLILTKSRTFWVAFAMGVVVLALVLPRAQRRRLAGVLTLGTAGLLGIAYVALGSVAIVLIIGVVNRLATLNTALVDVSLVNRFIETSAVWARIKSNPVVGHGFGAPYTYYSLIYEGTTTWSYIHNAYAAVWYKLGLWGVALFGTVWVRGAWCALRAGRAATLPPLERAAALGVVACLISQVLPAYATSVFVEDEKLVAFTLVVAIGCGLYQRAGLGPAPGLPGRPADPDVVEEPGRAAGA
jgi:hypothetical protein